MKQSKVKCLSKEKLSPQDRPTYPYMSKTPLEVVGKFEAEIYCPANGNSTIGEVVVIRGEDKTLLGRKTSIRLGILRIGPEEPAYHIKQQEVEASFQDIMQCVGLLKDYKLKIHVDPNVKPIAQPVRRLPFSLRMKVEEKLKELNQLDIIEEVKNGTPTKWVSPLV